MYKPDLNLAFHSLSLGEDWRPTFDFDGFDRVDVPVFWLSDTSLDASVILSTLKELAGV